MTCGLALTSARRLRLAASGRQGIASVTPTATQRRVVAKALQFFPLQIAVAVVQPLRVDLKSISMTG